MFAYYFLVIHLFGCVWFAIHRFIEANVKYTWATTDCPGGEDSALNGCLSAWVEKLGRHDICYDNMIWRCYVRSVYFVLTTMSTVGYGDISPVSEFETIFQNVVILTGACFFAGIIGSFGEYLSYNDESGSSAFKTKLQKLQEYMDYRHLPPFLQNQILFHHKTKWNQSCVLDEKTVTSMLPQPLQVDLSYEILAGTIQKFPIFCDTSLILLKRICHALTLQMCPATAIIYNAGDIGWDLYFIGAGLIQVELPSDLSILDEEGRASVPKMKEKAAAVGLMYKSGNHFGESCLVSTSGIRQETVSAKTIVELYSLSKHQLEQILTHASVKEHKKLLWNIRSKNGNIYHSFEEEVVVPTKIKTRNSTILRKPGMTKSPTSFLSWTKPQRHSLKQNNGNQDFERFYHRRLRSFSAQASTAALSTKNLKGSKLKHDAALQAARECKNIMIPEEKEDQISDGSSSEKSNESLRSESSNFG